jgi:ubiquinone biosynthesis O-methyltransferase
MNVASATYRVQQQPSLRSKLKYVHATAEALQAQGNMYDVIVASEVIEHVSDSQHFLSCIAEMTRPGGVIIISTFNKTILSYILGVFAAENIIKVASPGTHDWNKFIAPETVESILKENDAQTVDVTGVVVLPNFLSGGLNFCLSTLTQVNYILTAQKISKPTAQQEEGEAEENVRQNKTESK